MKKNSKLISLLLAAVLILGAVYLLSIDTASNIVEILTEDAEPEKTADSPQASAEAASQEEVPDEPDPAPADIEEPEEPEEEAAAIDENGVYTTKDDVALYIHTYGHLPGNFVTKKEAEAAGWSGGSLEKYLPGKCIGGSRFGNHEGALPDAKGRKWTECDINTLGKSSRGAERIVFSNDGLIYYTNDHYETFEQLY